MLSNLKESIMKLETQTRLAANLRRLRLSHGYSQSELARKLQVNRCVLAQYESGQRCPSLDVLYEMSQFYGLKMDVLLETEPVHIIDAAVRSSVYERDERELLNQYRRLSDFSKGRLLEKAEDLAAWDSALNNIRKSLSDHDK
jgi:transcriptional regulator with XRE-family HTH domain